MSAAERAERDANKVFHWIMMHSDKPRKAKPEAKAAAPSTAAGATANAAAAGGSTAAPAAATAAAPAKPARTEAAAAAPAVASGKPEAQPAGKSAPSSGGDSAKVLAAASPSAAAASAPTQLAAAVASPANAAAAAAEEDDDDDVALVPTAQVAPDFPANIMRQLRKGSVQVRFDVQADGTVSKTEVVKTTHRRLNDVATAAVTQWRFQPLRKSQSAIVELGFNLD